MHFIIWKILNGLEKQEMSARALLKECNLGKYSSKISLKNYHNMVEYCSINQ